jgi:hypothetical protein
MNREKILRKYRSVVTTDSVKARELIKKLYYKDDPVLLQCIAQTYLDESRFRNDGTPRLYLDKRKWRMAEKYIIKAFTLNDSCSNILYTMGSVRRSYGQTDIAIYCFKQIIKLGLKGAKYESCEINFDHAQELINDSKFELSRIYHETNNRLSKRYFSMYKKGLEKGIETIYKPLHEFLLH